MARRWSCLRSSSSSRRQSEQRAGLQAVACCFDRRALPLVPGHCARAPNRAGNSTEQLVSSAVCSVSGAQGRGCSATGARPGRHGPPGWSAAQTFAQGTGPALPPRPPPPVPALPPGLARRLRPPLPRARGPLSPARTPRRCCAWHRQAHGAAGRAAGGARSARARRRARQPRRWPGGPQGRRRRRRDGGALGSGQQGGRSGVHGGASCAASPGCSVGCGLRAGGRTATRVRGVRPCPLRRSRGHGLRATRPPRSAPLAAPLACRLADVSFPPKVVEDYRALLPVYLEFLQKRQASGAAAATRAGPGAARSPPAVAWLLQDAATKPCVAAPICGTACVHEPGAHLLAGPARRWRACASCRPTALRCPQRASAPPSCTRWTRTR
jgi:hypothetical protein